MDAQVAFHGTNKVTTRSQQSSDVSAGEKTHPLPGGHPGCHLKWLGAELGWDTLFTPAHTSPGTGQGLGASFSESTRATRRIELDHLSFHFVDTKTCSFLNSEHILQLMFLLFISFFKKKKLSLYLQITGILEWRNYDNLY